MNYKEEIERARYLISNTFGSLEFKEDTHQYFLPQPDGSRVEYDCVSNFTKQFDTTDFNEVAIRYAEKHGETPEFWKAEWSKRGEEACTLGTQVHEYAESLGWLSIGREDLICQSAKPQYDPQTGKIPPLKGLDKLSLKEQAAEKFWNELHPNLHFVMAETKVYTSVGPFAEVYPHNYAGTFDLLLYYDDPAGVNSGFCIFDYKGLPLDTPIPTVSGFINMGDLKKGMLVFDKEGHVCRITAVSEVHHNPCKKICFDNGESIVADENHRWLIGDTTVKTTAELLPGDTIQNHKPLEWNFYNDSDTFEIMASMGAKPVFRDSRVIGWSSRPRIITEILDTEMVPTKCIEVDSPSHTYLCTKSFIVTHNTNKTLKNGYAKKVGQFLAPPFDDLVEEAESHYTLQLSCYQIPLESIGLKVIARRLVHLTDKGDYTLVKLPDVTDRIKTILRSK